jgi:hypothetical protein
MNLLIAEKVFGAVWEAAPDVGRGWEREWLVRGGRAYGYRALGRIASKADDYSTDIAAAMQVVARANEECRASVTLCNTPHGTWFAQFGVFEFVEAETLPLAICRAALVSLPAFETLADAAQRLAARSAPQGTEAGEGA